MKALLLLIALVAQVAAVPYAALPTTAADPRELTLTSCCDCYTCRMGCECCTCATDTTESLTSTSTDLPPKFPNIDYVGRGYDIIAGNPQFTAGSVDGGYRQQVFKTNYAKNRTTGDGRFSLPDGIDAHSRVACSYETDTMEIKGETSYYQSISGSVSISGSGGAGSLLKGSFSASADYKRVSDEVYKQHRIEVHAHAQCDAYDAFVQAFSPPPFEDNFVAGVAALVKSPNDPDVLGRMVRAFGTHVSTGTVMGASCTMQSLFAESDYKSMLDQSFDFHTAASASFKLFTGDASGGGSAQQKLAQEFNTIAKRQVYSFVGVRPSGDGNPLTWASTVNSDPFPHSYTLQLLSELITPEFFSQFDTDALARAKSSLQSYTEQWCAQGGGSCAGPVPDQAPSMVKLYSNGGTQQVSFPCPQGVPISAGMASRNSVDGHWASNPGYYATASTASCWAPSESISCNALCTDAFSFVTWALSPQAAGVQVATCPSGYVVSSCGYSGQGGSNVEPYANSFPISPSSCSCYNYFGVQCVATCVPAQEVASYEVVSQYGTGVVTVQCPSNKRLLGCGYKSSGTGTMEQFWHVAPVSETACACYNYFGTTCYSICAEYY